MEDAGSQEIGRVIGGIMMGIRKGLEGDEEWTEERVLIKEVGWKGQKWRVGTVYVREKMRKKRRST